MEHKNLEFKDMLEYWPSNSRSQESVFHLQNTTTSETVKRWKSFTDPAFIVSSLAFGMTLAWYFMLHDLSNDVFASDSTLTFAFKQDVKLSTALFLLLAAFSAKLLQRKQSQNIVPVLVAASSAVISGIILMLFELRLGMSPIMLYLAGFFGGFSYVVALISWIRTIHEVNYADLFLKMGIGLFLAGVLCSLLLLIVSKELTIALSVVLPILSVAFSRRSFECKNDTKIGSELARHKLPKSVLFAIVLSSSLVFSILVGKWMPSISFTWVNAFIPCGIIIIMAGYLLTKRRAEFEIVYAAIIGVVLLVSILVLLPTFQSEAMYMMVFIGAWLLLFFALVSSVWYGATCENGSLRITCGLLFLIYGGQFAMNTALQWVPDFNNVLLIVAVVLLALSLVILLIVQTRTIAYQSHSIILGENSVETERALLADHYGLTERELDVLELLGKGNSIKRIAELLVVSESTVKFHRTNIYRKIGVNSKQELIDLMNNRELL